MRQRISGKGFLIEASILSVGLILSFFVFDFVRDFERNKIRTEFDLSARDRAELFKKEVENNLDVLYSVQSYFDASRYVGRDEFRKFTKNILLNQPDILAVSWMPEISHLERQSFEDMVRKEGFPDFQITEFDPDGHIGKSSERQKYSPTYYVEPFLKNKAIFGLDVSSEMIRRVALEKASIDGKPYATGWIKLAGMADDDFGCRIFLPIYRAEAGQGKSKWMSGDITGFVSVIFEVEKTAELSWKMLRPNGIDVYIYDKGDLKPEKILYLNNLKRQPFVGSEKDIFHKGELDWSTSFNFAGREWGMIFKPSPEYYSLIRTQEWLSWLVLLIGSLLSALLTVYVHELLGRTKVIMAEVKRRTFELSELNKYLEEEIVMRKEMEAKLRQANDKLKELDMRKSAFVSHVSHEFKNPLFTIQNATGIVLNEEAGPINQNQKKMLGFAKRGADKLIRLVTDLLDLSKIESGKVELKREEVDFVSLVDEVLEDQEPRISQKGQKLKADLSDRIGRVWADRDKLGQVILNLVSNAIKYTPPSGEIDVKACENGGEVRFEIADNGPGIAKEDQDRIFDKYERIVAENEEGTGLGLSIAKDIVDLHKGKIWVESELGNGSKFIFTIPRDLRS